jgi:hypothetical protein
MAMPEYENLKRLVAEVEEDVNKAIGGNKAAGTRVRKKILEGREGETDVASAPGQAEGQ